MLVYDIQCLSPVCNGWCFCVREPHVWPISSPLCWDCVLRWFPSPIPAVDSETHTYTQLVTTATHSCLNHRSEISLITLTIKNTKAHKNSVENISNSLISDLKHRAIHYSTQMKKPAWIRRGLVETCLILLFYDKWCNINHILGGEIGLIVKHMHVQ